MKSVLFCLALLIVAALAEETAPAAAAPAAATPSGDAAASSGAHDFEHDADLKTIEEGVAKILEEHKQAFKTADKDNDGKLTLAEFAEMEKQADSAVTDQEIKEMFDDEDPNGDGVVTQEEWDQTFERAVQDASNKEMSQSHSEEELKEHRDEFDELDLDKNGILDAEEIKKGWSHHTGNNNNNNNNGENNNNNNNNNEVDESWKEQDTNGDGQLSFEEFVMSPPHDEELAKLWKELEEDEKSFVDVEDHNDAPDVEEHDLEDLEKEEKK